MQKQYIFILLLIVILFYNCSKDKIDPPQPSGPPFIEECEDIPPVTGVVLGGWGHSWTATYPIYDLPRFNPNDPNEIILRLRKEPNASAFQLVKYNLVTKAQETIYEGDFIFPRWSKKDWVIMTQSDFNLYKIKSNGDSLTQLTTTGNCHGVEWNITGDKFIYESIQVNNLSIICNEFGMPLDTLETGGTISPSWQHDSLVTNKSAASVFIFNPYSKEPDFDAEIIQEMNEGGTSLADWMDNENVIWSNFGGIFKSNIITKETETLIASCDSRHYQFPSVSKISKKILFQRIDKDVTDIENNKGILNTRIFIMNFDGSEKEELDLSL